MTIQNAKTNHSAESISTHLISLAFIFYGLQALVSLPAYAADQSHITEYKLYTEALSHGDQTAAEQHGRAAWQAAETELGDDSLTAILAYNYGQLVLFTNTADALAALTRADELQKAGVTELPPDELRLYLAYAEFAESGGKKKQSRELNKALTAIESLGIKPDADLARMAFELAIMDLQQERYDEAILSSARAEQYLLLATPNDYKAIASAILVSGVAKLVPHPRKAEDVIAAHTDFERGKDLFSPQKDVESFDSTFAQLIAWSAAADAAVVTLGEDHSMFGESLEENSSPYSPYFETAVGIPEDCGFKWIRTPPNFPNSLANKGYIGAVIIVYDIADDLTVQNPQILAEVPTDTFGRAAIKSMQKWRAESEPADHPGCRINLTTQFTFVLPD